jgi:hypothetical protein
MTETRTFEELKCTIEDVKLCWVECSLEERSPIPESEGA